MEQFIGCDAHKKYSVFVAVNERGEASPAIRVGHDREQYRQFLERLPAGSQIALEAGGHYYWMVDEMEAAGHQPRLVHPLEAKKRVGKTGKKTDKVDANGLGILLRNGTLPEVWIPPSGLRDQRESLRLRMFLVQQRTRLKNRIQGALARYNIQMAGCATRMMPASTKSSPVLPLPEHLLRQVGIQIELPRHRCRVVHCPGEKSVLLNSERAIRAWGECGCDGSSANCYAVDFHGCATGVGGDGELDLLCRGHLRWNRFDCGCLHRGRWCYHGSRSGLRGGWPTFSRLGNR